MRYRVESSIQWSYVILVQKNNFIRKLIKVPLHAQSITISAADGLYLTDRCILRVQHELGVVVRWTHEMRSIVVGKVLFIEFKENYLFVSLELHNYSSLYSVKITMRYFSSNPNYTSISIHKPIRIHVKTNKKKGFLTIN